MARDVIKYATERIVRYLGTPKDERLQRKVERKATREPWQSRWFGMMPISIGVWKSSRRKTSSTEHPSSENEHTS
ncbi:YqzE family protein [Xylanibacillus composti]|uniref:YqzE-like protein n=1 Tax=Xylanibacillus composti TaxID=1572762 RepID=A0A8J4H7B9_9BACL|nr:YqzE family protein [Xylanibacillus composti]MDT9725013.1 YqzE family protein [Xylanibacillus composti]GIQ71306.1 hypothetical protein XYCOK13_41300 [Xylanibacillus composti]